MFSSSSFPMFGFFATRRMSKSRRNLARRQGDQGRSSVSRVGNAGRSGGSAGQREEAARGASRSVFKREAPEEALFFNGRHPEGSCSGSHSGSRSDSAPTPLRVFPPPRAPCAPWPPSGGCCWNRARPRLSTARYRARNEPWSSRV